MDSDEIIDSNESSTMSNKENKAIKKFKNKANNKSYILFPKIIKLSSKLLLTHAFCDEMKCLHFTNQTISLVVSIFKHNCNVIEPITQHDEDLKKISMLMQRTMLIFFS